MLKYRSARFTIWLQSKWIHYLLLLLVILVAYRQVAINHYSFIWDAADQYFPWRFHLSECIRNGYLPFWNPYQMCGYPFYADPQACAWHPVVWFFSLFGSYTMYTMQAEFLFYVFMGSVGMYQLVRSFCARHSTPLFAALCYAGCGFFVANAEHFTWIGAAAVLPWLFWAYRQMIRSLAYGYALVSAISLHLLLSSGYPAFFVVTAYVLFACFLLSMVRARNGQARRRIIVLNLTMALGFAVISGVVLLSYAQAQPYISRGAGISAAIANKFPFAPNATISFLLPFATLKEAARFGSDLSMVNGYFGIIACAMLCMSYYARSRTLWTILAVACLMLLVSFGAATPIRSWLYHYLPLMNMFRFPALFRIYSIIGFIIAASLVWDKLLGKDKLPVKATLLAAFPSIVIAWLFFMSILKHGWLVDLKAIRNNWFDYLQTASLAAHIQLQGFIQLVLLLLFTAVLLYYRSGRLRAGLLLIIAAVDIVAATQLNMYGTVVTKVTASEILERTGSIRGFPIPDNTRPVLANHDGVFRDKMSPQSTNFNIFHKQIAFDGYNPFQLKRFKQLAESASLRDSVWSNPYMYCSSKIATDTPLRARNALLVEEQIGKKIQNTALTDCENLNVRTFSPNEVIAQVATQGTTILTLQQNGFPGWRVSIDGKATEHFVSAGVNLSVLVPAGNHEVCFQFEPPYIRFAFILSTTVLIGVVVVLIVFRRRFFKPANFSIPAAV